ncbi:FmdB family zinc ribbon protein [Sphaerisporangium perillae]|uniref:FmdB family zinc ribbon protein n=1 Tax=Sphaerisporangium perillae TaxID=2935860 RepID=UPI00201026D4|nr:FmdB family zinc ribbon protein [Sphaerisporangium perillae]
MPTYQYACTACGEGLEVVQRFTDDPLTACPSCEGQLRKVFSPVGIVFKGSGFYRTDNRSSGASTSTSTAASTSSSDSSGATSSSGSDSGSTGTSTKKEPASASAPASAGSSAA